MHPVTPEEQKFFEEEEPTNGGLYISPLKHKNRLLINERGRTNQHITNKYGHHNTQQFATGEEVPQLKFRDLY